MSKLIKLAKKFEKIISAKELKDDLLYKHNPYMPEENRIEIERTEEMEEIVRDILETTVFMRREFNDILKEKGKASIEGDLAKKILGELDEIESTFSYDDAFHFNTQNNAFGFEEVESAISMIDLGLEYAKGVVKVDGEVVTWFNQLKNNINKLRDLSVRQSDWLRTQFIDAANMLEQDTRGIDELSREDLHVNYTIEDKDTDIDADIDNFEPSDEDTDDAMKDKSEELYEGFEADPEIGHYGDFDDMHVKPGKSFHAR